MAADLFFSLQLLLSVVIVHGFSKFIFICLKLRISGADKRPLNALVYAWHAVDPKPDAGGVNLSARAWRRQTGGV